MPGGKPSFLHDDVAIVAAKTSAMAEQETKEISQFLDRVIDCYLGLHGLYEKDK